MPSFRGVLIPDSPFEIDNLPSGVGWEVYLNDGPPPSAPPAVHRYAVNGEQRDWTERQQDKRTVCGQDCIDFLSTVDRMLELLPSDLPVEGLIIRLTAQGVGDRADVLSLDRGKVLWQRPRMLGLIRPRLEIQYSLTRITKKRSERGPFKDTLTANGWEPVRTTYQQYDARERLRTYSKKSTMLWTPPEH